MTRIAAAELGCHEMSPEARVLALARREDGHRDLGPARGGRPEHEGGSAPSLDRMARAAAPRCLPGRPARGAVVAGEGRGARRRPGALLSHIAAGVLWAAHRAARRPGRRDAARSQRPQPPGHPHPSRPPPRSPTTSPAAATSPSRARPGHCSTSPPDSRQASSPVPSKPPRYSGGSHLIPSLSSSRATPTTGERAALRTHRPDPAFTSSEAERRLLELIRAARLPDPRTNVKVGGHEVDLLWPAQRLIVEVDGFAFHSTRAAFERDRRPRRETCWPRATASSASPGGGSRESPRRSSRRWPPRSPV